MTSKAYVFVEGLADKPVICAEFRLNTTTNTGRFRYGKSYLARNHAMLYCFEQRGWHLSPAYDVLPVNNSRQHSMGIGDSGREGSIENALSQSKRFGLPHLQLDA